jgi:hypothetical protein
MASSVEVEGQFNENGLAEAQKGARVGLEKLKIRQRLVNSFPHEHR